MAPSSDESFLARWSRLKQRPAQPEEDRQGEPPPNDAAGDALARESIDDGRLSEAAAGDAEVCEDGQSESAPAKRDFTEFNFDELDFDSDYRQFMKDDVPEDARNKALRRLWTSNPVLANMDGLDDYCEDYTDAAVVPIGPLKTAYKIGRGFLSDSEVAEWEALGRPADEEVALADEADASSDGEAGGDAADGELPAEEAAVVAAGEAEASAAQDERALPGADPDAAGCPGAACAAAVKREEEEALAAYEAEVKGGGESGAGASDGAAAGAPREKDQRQS